MDKAMLQAIFNKIKEYKRIIIFQHGRPDGDAIGSSYGLSRLLEASFNDKEIYVSGESSEFTSYIGTPELVDEELLEGSLAICLDTGNSERIFDQRFKQCKEVIKIDHHIPVDEYGDISYVDTGRPACTLIILDLYNLYKEELTLTKEAAEALYFGTLTDTGRFKYSGVDGDTFRSVATLYDAGIDTRKLFLYLDERSEDLTRFKGFLLQNYKKTENGVVYFKVLPKYLEEFNVTLEEATSLVNELGVFKDCPIWLLFAEYEEGIVRARMRSKGPAINELANRFDGGGHAMACGANLGTWDRTEELIKASDELAKEYKSKEAN